MARTRTCTAAAACLPHRCLSPSRFLPAAFSGKITRLPSCWKPPVLLPPACWWLRDPTPGDIGAITLVTLIVFSASPASSFGKALSSGLLALAGALLQTVFALALWPVKRYLPESRALAVLYAELAQNAASSAPASEVAHGHRADSGGPRRPGLLRLGALRAGRAISRPLQPGRTDPPGSARVGPPASPHRT